MNYKLNFLLLQMLIQSNMSTSGLNQNDAEWSALQKYRKQHQRVR